MTSTNQPRRTTWKETWKEWLALLLLHCVFLIVASMTVGFFLEVALSRYWLNTGLEPFAPMIALVALLLGYLIASRSENGRIATWTWTVGAMWLVVGICDLAFSEWSLDKGYVPQQNRWAYVFVELFGRTSQCSQSECIGEFIFTMPFTASVMYSIGAFIKIRSLAKRLRTSKDSSTVADRS